uniref:Uncharacterized protein n=1 Tax=Mycena chlorophos TaxID=658473 RepID=A0ABQ0LYH0_MYCCL|nr:predicted protein [Mycena chlorophos]
MYLSQAVVYHHLFQLAPGSLRRLRGNIHHLLGNNVYKHMRLHSSLVNLTHLEIQDNAEPLSDILLSVLCLPAITHISLWVLKAERMAAQIAPHAQTIIDALAPTGPVHAFALVQSFNRLGEIAVDHGFTLPDALKSHYRFVLWPGDIHDATTNWRNGARMEGDFWDHLDRCVDFQWRSYYWRAKKREEEEENLKSGGDV